MYDELIKEINDKVDLLEYISKSIDLKKRGNQYFGSCPLHIDKTPSLSVNPSRNLFYCFSCGKGGGIVQFLKYYEKLKFHDALNKAMALAGINTATYTFSDTVLYLKNVKNVKHKKENDNPHEILDKNILQKYQRGQVTEWLNEGIRQEEMDLFDIRIDNLSNRIIYPVYDFNGNLINIKGRTRYDNYKSLNIMKYMNYYKVNTLDYFQGLNITYPYIKEKGEIIIFESIKSVMKAYGWGYKNCVSAENHILTKEQMKLLIKMKANVVLAYDSDVKYFSKTEARVCENIKSLKRFLNVSIIQDNEELLGGINAKNSPVDLGRDIWEMLYKEKVRV